MTFRKPGLRALRLPAGAVREIPAAVDELCRSYAEIRSDEFVPSLLAVAALVLDFQCIRPFRHAQTRMTHLIAVLGLCQNGFDVGRFASLARWFERSREECSKAVHLSSERWHEGGHLLDPWLEYFFR